MIKPTATHGKRRKRQRKLALESYSGRLGLRKLRGDAGALVLGEDVDAALVALGAGPFLIEESVDDGECLFLGVHAATDANELSVVVLACKAGGLRGPREGTTSTLHLVRSDLLAVAGATEHDAERTRIVDGALGGVDAVCRVVILGIISVGTTVNNFVALVLQVFSNDVLRLEPCVVCS